MDVGKSPNIPYVYVRHHGEVQNYKPLQVMTACTLDIYNFPFDVQNCSLTFTSWLHTSESRGFGRWENRWGPRDACMRSTPGDAISLLQFTHLLFVHVAQPLFPHPLNGTDYVAVFTSLSCPKYGMRQCKLRARCSVRDDAFPSHK